MALNRWRNFILFVLLLGGFGLRLALHDYHGLEGDDAFSLALSHNDTGELVSGLMTLRLDVHPPLHFLALKGWTALAGESLLALRLMNILADVLAGALLVRLAGRAFGQRASILALALWLPAPLLIYADNLIRMYALLVPLVTGGALCVVEAPRSKRAAWWYIGAAGFALAAMWSHILGVVALAAYAAGIISNIFLRIKGDPASRPYKSALMGIGALMVAAVLYLPFALPVLDVYRSGRTLGAEFSPVNFTSPLEIPGTILATTLAHRALNSPLVGLIVLLLFAAGSIWLLSKVRRVGARRALPLLLMTWVVIIALSVLAWAAGFYKPRYLAPFVPLMLATWAGIILINIRVGALRQAPLRLVALVILFVVTLTGLVTDLKRDGRDDWVAAARFVQQRERPGDSIIVIPDWGQEAFRFHYNGDAPITGILPQVGADVDLDAALNPLVDGRDRVWLIRYQTEVSDPVGRANDWFRARAVTVTEAFPISVQVILYDFMVTVDALPPDVRPMDVQFADVAALRGAMLPLTRGSTTDTRLHPPSNWVQVILYWESLQGGADFVPRVRFTDSFGQVYGAALERDNDLLRRFPVATWEAGRIYEVVYDLNLNPATPTGVYNIEVMALDPSTGEPMLSTGADAGEYWAVAGQFEIEF
ncbi:MAG: glycosyltransferase family 39 protein [Burkholderiales bacterium]|nr:glycosyltransferase family 39 protein [Anaerolineae bacterium]